jgi:hypothetical protein
MVMALVVGVFGVGTAAAVPDTIETPVWSQFDQTPSIGNPAVQATDSDAATTTFVAAGDGSVRGREFTGGSYGLLQNIGGFSFAGPGMSVGNASDVAIWVQGGDHALWRNECDSDLDPTSCTGWRSHGGQLKDNPAAVKTGGNLHVFVRGLDDQLWWNVIFTDDTTRGWIPLGGRLTSGPAVAVADSGNLAVVVRGTDGAVWMLRVQPLSTGVTSGWSSIGGQIIGNPALINDTLTVLATGTDNVLWYNSENGCCFPTWTNLNGFLTSGPAASLDGTPGCGPLAMAARGGDSRIWVARPNINEECV